MGFLFGDVRYGGQRAIGRGMGNKVGDGRWPKGWAMADTHRPCTPSPIAHLIAHDPSPGVFEEVCVCGGGGETQP